MNLCSDNHVEICFEGRNCPLCALRDELENRINSMDDDLKRLQEQIDELKAKGDE